MRNINTQKNKSEKPVSDLFYNTSGKSYFPDEWKDKSTQGIIKIIKDCDNFDLSNYNNPDFIQEGKDKYSFALPKTCFLLFTHGTW